MGGSYRQSLHGDTVVREEIERGFGLFGFWDLKRGGQPDVAGVLGDVIFVQLHFTRKALSNEN